MAFGAFKNLKKKLMGGGGKTERLPLAAYGKLGLYKDYINLECNDGPAAEFKAWLDGGFGLTFEEFGGRAVTVEGPKRLLWRLAGGKHYAVASLWPSADEGGLRKFPFAFYVTLPKSSIGGESVYDVWLFLEQIWIALEGHYSRAVEMKTIDEFYGAFRGQIVEAVDAGAEMEGTISVQDWVQGLDSSNPEDYGGRLTQNLTALISACREYADHGADLAVRLPLSPSIPLAIQVCVWERVFRENLKKCASWPSMVLPTTPSGEAPSLNLIWREPRKDDSRLLATDLAGYDFIEDIQGEMLHPRGLYVTHPLPHEALAADLDSWIRGLGKGK